MVVSIKRGIFVAVVLVLLFNSLGFVLAQDTNEVVEVVPDPSLNFREWKLLDAGSLTSIAILLIFTIASIALLIYSKTLKSKSLKTSIILPLLFWILGIIFWIGHLFSIGGRGVVLDLGAFFMIYWFFFSPIILISIGFSIFAFVKLKEKRIPTINLVLNIIYFIIWIIFISTATMG